MKTRAMFAAVVGAAVSGSALSAESLRDALAATKPIVDWRLRYEGVDQAGFVENADALTSRLRAGIVTGELGGTSLLAEGVWVEDLLDDYDSTTNGATEYPVVADPAGFAAVNRFAVVNRSLENATFTVGRQRIIHGNARFVGNVGWRQNEQTFDGVRAEVGFGRTKLDVAYANQVNRVFGPDSPVGRWDGDLVLARVSRPFEWGEAAAFAYRLELDDAPAMSSDTYGIELVGSRPIGGGISGRYAAAIARQTDRHPSPLDLDETYSLFEVGIGFSGVTIDIGRETLGGNGQAAFSTPLATLHLFQGWTDKFLATPPAGIVDTYLEVGYAVGARGPFERVAIVAAFRSLESDAGSASYGDELDVSLVAKLARLSRTTFTLKYADYAADELHTDTVKLWASVDYAF